MATKNPEQKIEPTQGQNPSQNPSVTINAQYVKDLSFENNEAPMSLVPTEDKPKVDISLNLEAKELQEGTYEVVLHITSHSKAADKDLFVAELKYCGLFTLSNIPEEHKESVLLIHCPTVLFPFARRIMSDITRDGGFSPLMIDPIDFNALYMQRKEKISEDKKNNIQ